MAFPIEYRSKNFGRESSGIVPPGEPYAPAAWKNFKAVSSSPPPTRVLLAKLFGEQHGVIQYRKKMVNLALASATSLWTFDARVGRSCSLGSREYFIQTKPDRNLAATLA